MSMPYFEREFTFYQPDGTPLRVKGFGNQDSAVFETLDGYTVVQNPESGFYEYATLNERGDLVPTGHRAKKTPPKKLGLKRHLRSKRHAQEMPEVTMSAAEQYLERPRWQMRRMERPAVGSASVEALEVTAAAAAPQRQKIGNFVGLCLLIDFPDVPGTIPREEVEAYCNQPGYNGFGNNGSVFDYFFENSNGLLSYTSIVAPYYTAIHERSHYADPTRIYPRGAVELLREALESLKLQDIDLSSLSVDNQQCVYATNVFYAGGNPNGFQQGLYPHTGLLSPRHELMPGQLIADYQFTNMGTQLTLGTFCHENGHMLCEFPDLYDLTPDTPDHKYTHGVGKFCLMGYGANEAKNPAQIGAYLKYRAGWANNVTEITTGLHSSVRAGVNDFYIHKKNEQEYFIIENRQKVGRDRALPGSGLAIWHVDETGSNNFQQMTPEQHYECSLEQADGLFDLERSGDAGQAKDLFHGAGTASFGDATTPDSRWWDGSPSGLNISNISNNSPTMSFVAED